MGLLNLLRNLRTESAKEAQILVLGLDNAGKTTILKKLSEEEISQIKPTQGFNIKSLSQDGFKLNMWDIGGQKAIRPYWKNYFDRTNGIVFVVDSSDEERLQEAVAEFKELMAEEQLANLPLLVFANKQDLELACGADEVLEALELSAISDRQWQIQACSAVTSEGLQEGMSWLVETMSKRE